MALRRSGCFSKKLAAKTVNKFSPITRSIVEEYTTISLANQDSFKMKLYKEQGQPE
jgi:hypothetical protein